jgi:hypothetical protein
MQTLLKEVLALSKTAEAAKWTLFESKLIS